MPNQGLNLCAIGDSITQSMNEEAASYTIPEGEAPSESVIKTIASLEDRDPTALDTTLYTVIDPDALDRLFERFSETGGGKTGRIVFEFLDYEVTVRCDGTIEVSRPTTSATDHVA